MNKYYLKVASFVALFAMCVALMPAGAAGVSLTRGATDADGEIDTAGTDGYATTTVFWPISDDYAAGTQIRVTIDWSNTGVGSTTAALAGCATSSAFGSPITYGTPSVTGHTITLTNAVTAPHTGGVCVRVPVTDAGVLYTGNFSLAVITTNVAADYGAVEYYVLGGNDVLVDASVQPTLEFAIVSSTDVTVEKHECHMGTLDLVSVGTCDYRLRVSTNAASGFGITIESDHDLSTVTYATITNIVEDSGTVAFGTEGYGIAVASTTAGGNDGTGLYTESIIKAGNFTDNDSPVPTAAAPIYNYTNSYIGNSVASTPLIQHRAAIDGATVVGYYSQNVTYRISPTF